MGSPASLLPSDPSAATSGGLRVLVSAYACNPYRGSEDAVGWGWIRAIAAHNEVHVITADFQRESVERWHSENPGDRASVHFHYVAPRLFHYRPTRMWTRIESSYFKPLMNFAYAQWLRDGARLAAALHEQHQFDLVHLITYVGYRFPGRYWEMDIPFVWGPIGGLENTPWRFLPSLGLGGGLYLAARNLVNSIQKRTLRSSRCAFRRARGGLIAATEGTRRQIQRFYRVDADVIPEVGLPSLEPAHPAAREQGEALRIVWSGIHLPRKALPFLLHALARLDGGLDWRLSVLGRGGRTATWQALSEQLGLEDRVHWTGWLEREAALEEMRSAHVFVITSLEDLTSTVLIEALAHGLPVICPDHCGFSNVVNADCGIKVSLRTPDQFVRDLAHAISALAGDEVERRRLGRGALERAQQYTWEGKAGQLDSIYARVTAGARSACDQDARRKLATGAVRAC